jgi:hypothetical protein
VSICAVFVVHFILNAPSGEWVTGIEASPGRFFPSWRFPAESAGAMDAVAMNAALRRNPWLREADALLRVAASVKITK